MISSSLAKGQTAIETLATATIFLIIFLYGTNLMFHGFGTILLTKWASRVSHCAAEGQSNEMCAASAKASLLQNFALQKVQVRVSILRGVIHSEITASLLNQHLRGTYDLEPSEYKRVQ